MKSTEPPTLCHTMSTRCLRILSCFAVGGSLSFSCWRSRRGGWTTCDAAFFGIERPANVPATVQDRAYTSPAWYTP